MTIRTSLRHKLATAAIAGTMLMLGAGGTASARDEAAAAHEADKNADAASASLARKRFDRAASAAEAAVALRPQEARYRVLLGQVYLKGGRFVSAQQALSDALTLAPTDGRVALNLVLAQIGAGKWADARRTLDAKAALIPAADRGLALALAGDPATAVDVLTQAARSGSADAKTRQNLALALALAGRWPEARAIVAVDLPPADVDRRLVEWAAFAQPRGASDQVASLLGVVPVADKGQPVALALVTPAPVMAAAPTMPPVAAPITPVAVKVAVAPAPVATPVAPVTMAKVVAPPAAVQPPLIVAPAAFKTRLAAAPVSARPAAAFVPAKGEWFVQLGAFDSAGVARDGWARATRRFASFSRLTPSGASFATNGTSFYRLSVGGFARADAVTMCQRYRARGGSCFVRQGAGDRMAQWVKPSVQLAAKQGPVKVAAKAPAKGVQLASR